MHGEREGGVSKKENASCKQRAAAKIAVVKKLQKGKREGTTNRGDGSFACTLYPLQSVFCSPCSGGQTGENSRGRKDLKGSTGLAFSWWDLLGVRG